MPTGKRKRMNILESDSLFIDFVSIICFKHTKEVKVDH
ncbi:hypothetical protein M089_5455 [Bacteroides ovatus str. 3725 D9 iii]|jgi:hypothetical protein|nr:hypothetical protein M089_5455 [Bacteroides ovatus str. 3725 D9 iii]KDS24921.1 hypothetical protein M088_4702 [Bacteroides ovatus str. 3725 D1 iv]